MKCLHNDLWLSTHDLNCKSATATFCFRFWHMLSLAGRSGFLCSVSNVGLEFLL